MEGLHIKRNFVLWICAPLVLIDLGIRLLIPLYTTALIPFFWLAIFGCIGISLHYFINFVSHPSGRLANGAKAGVFLVLFLFWFFGGSLYIQGWRRAAWFEQKKGPLGDIVRHQEANKTRLTGHFTPAGVAAGFEVSARTNQFGQLELIIPVAGQVPRGGFIYISGKPPPPELGLTLVLTRNLGDGWYEFIVSNSDGTHPIERK